MNGTFKRFVSLLLAAALLIPSGWLTTASAAGTPDIPVILYHRILASGGDDYTTSLSEFNKQMKYLNDNGYHTLSAEQYVRILDGTETAPDKPILLTFDDGTPDFVANALPVLKSYGMNSVAFIVTDWIGGGYAMSAAQLEALADEPSVSLQNHTKTHDQTVWTSGITADQANTEIATANAYLENITGKDPILLAYPYGTYNADVQQAAADNGFDYAFKVGTPDSGDLALGRNIIMNTTKMSQFATMVGGPPVSDGIVETVYHETFASGVGKATQSGGATLAQVGDVAFAGNADGKALSVSGRANDYDAADFTFSNLGLQDGKTYSVTASVYVGADVDVPTGTEVWIQVSGSPYTVVSGKAIAAGGAVTLSGSYQVDATANPEVTTFRIKTNEAGKTVPFYIGDFLVTSELAGAPDVHEDFSAGLGKATQSGNATFTPVTGKTFDGNPDGTAIHLTNRHNDYDALDFKIADNGLINGVTYAVTVQGYVDADATVPSGSQAFLQTVNSYSWYGSANLVPGEAFTLTGQVTIDTSKDSAIRIQSNAAGATVPFYVGDVYIKGPGSIPVQTDLIPIKDAYEDDFLIGNAVSTTEFDGKRLELLQHHFNVVTAENAMKPDQAYNASKAFDFADEDALVAKIEAAGLLLHGHVLVWHQQTPAWLNTGTDNAPLSRDVALANMRTHIRTVMEHFGDKVISWDVVNEAMNDNPPNPQDWQASLRNSPWKAAIGADYVEQAFLAAREVIDENPDMQDIKLYYNDYNEDNQNKATAIYNMVKALNDKYALTHPGKLLVDGVGMQGHYNAKTNPDNVQLSLEKFISLGVEVSVSELDITAGTNSQQSDREKIAQGYLYAKLFSIFEAHADHIARVTFWGLNDATSWRSEGSPLPFDKDLQAKQAYYAIMDPESYMAEHPPELTEVRNSTAKYGTPRVDGTVDAIWNGAAAMPLNRYQLAWQGATGTAKALWDDRNLYVLFQVTDQQLDHASANPWEQDSVEVFLDQDNEKSSSYKSDDGQFRINYLNETSFNPPSIAEGFVSAVTTNGSNYTVEVKIPLGAVTPANDLEIGFDAQINDAKDGARQSVAAWNDTSGMGYQDPSVFGVLKLVGKGSAGNSSGGGGGGGGSGGSVNTNDGRVSIAPSIASTNGRTVGTVTGDLLKQALAQATADTGGAKSIAIDIPAQPNSTVYELQLPTVSLQSQDAYELTVRTAGATIRVPSHMLAKTNVGADQVSILIAPASLEGLDAATRERIGDRPAFDLSVVAGGNAIAWNDPSAPVTVAIPYKPTAEELAHPDRIVVWYIDGEGHANAVPNGRYDAATGTVVFRTTHFSSYAVASVSRTFGDLGRTEWARAAVEAMAARDVIKGTGADAFSPSASIKRADFVALLVRALELKGSGKAVASFDDVPANAYYAGELSIAKELGIANGTGGNAFKPDSSITRQEMMVLTARSLKAAGKSLAAGGTLDAFADGASVAGYAQDSATALVKAGVVSGKNGKLAPTDSLTRAEAAVILYSVWKL